jgi:elongator complex protein 3
MRELGATRLEIGLQHTDDDILTLIKRGHTAAEAKDALELLRNYGFKADVHLMPQLPGSTPERDLLMIKKTFDDPGFKPDMIKLYPCSVVKNSELYDWFLEGKYKAYPTTDLIRILKEGQRLLPRYTRVSRLIRDIPSHYIEEGNKVTNLRQVVEDEMKRDGIQCQCLRCREVGHVDPKTIADPTPVLYVDEYATHGGTEYFLSFEDKDRRVVFAFCRLRILDKNPSQQPKKIHYPAFIRELHTYGKLLELGTRNVDESQHKGLGRKLVEKAEEICRTQHVSTLAVISGVGVRDYYRKWGYELENTYMVKKMNYPAAS